MDVDKPRRYRQSTRVDLVGAARRDTPDGHNLVTVDRNVRLDRRVWRTGEHRPAANHQVVRTLPRDERRRASQRHQRTGTRYDKISSVRGHFSRLVASRDMRMAARLA